MKRIKVIISVFAVIVTLFGAFNIKTQTVKAEVFSGYINPYFSAYMEDETKGAITELKTVYDMTAYHGKNTENVSVVSEYKIENVQEGAIFCYPVITSPFDLDNVSIEINGTTVIPEIGYGNTPRFYASDNNGVLENVEELISSVQPIEIADGMGTMYVFETSSFPLEISFTKNADQSVFHSGLNRSRQGQGAYSIGWDDNTAVSYRLFVTNGALPAIEANVAFSAKNMTYKEFADFYIEEVVAAFGEELRGVYYNQFNRNISGKFLNVSEVLFNFNDYVFALMKTPLPTGTVNVTLRSQIKPMQNLNFEPSVYVVQTIAPKPQVCNYTAQVKTSDSFPYIIESNVPFENNIHTATELTSESYFIVCSKKYPYTKTNDNNDNKWIWIVGICLGGVGVSGLIVSFVVWRKDGKRR